MATYKADHLKAMIREVVRQEIREVVSGVIAEVLSERYLKQIAESAARPRGVGPTMHIADGDDHVEEDTPEVLRNRTKGIYKSHPMKHDDSIDEEEEVGTTMPEGKTRNEMLSLFFEGTKPLKEIEAREEEGVQLEELDAPTEDASGRRPIVEVWQTLAGVGPKKAEVSDDEVEAARAREERRLKQLRESLERPA